MTNLYKIEDIVKDVLTKFEDSRSDDFILIYRVYQQINENAVVRQPFYDIMLNHKRYGLPPFESVSRARRKIQSKYPELSNKKIADKRLNKTSEYISYAIDDNRSSSFRRFIDTHE